MVTRLTKATAFICVAVLYVQSLTAQNTNDFGGWYVGNFLYKADSTWNFFFETQTRSQKVGDIFFYHEFKGGFSYNILKKHSVLFGFGDYKTYSSTGNYKSPMLAKEFRMWEQLTLNNNIGRLKIDHRYRIEQRWLNGEFRNRFRYRINPLVPVNHKTIVDNTFFVSLFEEVFFTNTAPYFERNRFFAGAGYEFNSLVTTQLGWIRQYDYRKIDDGTGKNFLQLTMFFIIDHSNNARERHPGTLD